MPQKLSLATEDFGTFRVRFRVAQRVGVWWQRKGSPGVTNRTVQQRESLAEIRRNLLSSRLIKLMRIVDGSAQLAYPRRLHMPNISRQLVVIIGMRGHAASKDLVAESGREKAQISRGVKALEEAGLIDRTPSGRSMSLTASGRATFTGMMTIARERN